jgi:hypothetical protein
MTNRLHTFTRWPKDPERRIELAKVDLAFCRVMEKHGMGSPAIWQIRHFANRELGLARLELGELE